MTFIIENVGQMLNASVTKPFHCPEQQVRGGIRPLKLKLAPKKSHLLHSASNEKSFSNITLTSRKIQDEQNFKMENQNNLFLPLFDGQITEYLEKIYSQNSLNTIIKVIRIFKFKVK